MNNKGFELPQVTHYAGYRIEQTNNLCLTVNSATPLFNANEQETIMALFVT